MSATGRAHAQARVRAMKSRLIRRADALPLLSATDEASTSRALATFGLDPREDLFEQLFARLDALYRIVVRLHRGEDALFRAMHRLWDVERAKRAWRGGGEVTGELAPVIDGLLRAHGDDRVAAELALDRWASHALLDAARALPPRERLARELVETIVRERDGELVRRGPRFYGIPHDVARGLAVLGRSDTDPNELRARRRLLCRRAFVGHTFELAPSVAFLLLAEEELRGVIALAERRGDASLDQVAENVLSAGLMGEVA